MPAKRSIDFSSGKLPEGSRQVISPAASFETTPIDSSKDNNTSPGLVVPSRYTERPWPRSRQQAREVFFFPPRLKPLRRGCNPAVNPKFSRFYTRLGIGPDEYKFLPRILRLTVPILRVVNRITVYEEILIKVVAV